MSGSRFPLVPVLVLALATAWAAGGSGASPSRHAAGSWNAPPLLAQVGPPAGGVEGGVDEEDEVDPADTLGVEGDEPVNPDTTRAVPPPVPSAPDTTQPPLPSPPDTAGAAAATVDSTAERAPLDTLRGTFPPAVPDSVRAAARRAAAADSGVKDTLFTVKPRTPAPQTGTTAQESKPRSGIFGIHPVAILLGLAVLHYFVVKAAGD